MTYKKPRRQEEAVEKEEMKKESKEQKLIRGISGSKEKTGLGKNQKECEKEKEKEKDHQMF